MNLPNLVKLSAYAILIVAPFVLVNFVFENDFGNYTKRRDEMEKSSFKYGAIRLFKYSLQEFPYNPKVNIDAMTYFQNYRLTTQLIKLSDSYTKMVVDDNGYRDFALAMLSVGYYKSGLSVFDHTQLEETEDKSTATYSFAKALELENLTAYDEAEQMYILAMKKGDFDEIVMLHLESMWRSVGNSDRYRKLAYNDEVFKHLPFSVKNFIYLEDKSYGWYVYNILYRDYLSADALGYLGVIFAALVWLFFLMKLLFITSKKWKYLLFLFVLSSLFAGLVYPISDLFRFVLESLGVLWTRQDFGYDFLVIGWVEESVKMIPWVLVYYIFRKQFTRPVHFMILPIISALAFSFTENLIYVNSGDYDLIFTRSTICIAIHIASSSIIGYMLFMSHSKRIKMHWSLALLVGLFFASLLHGLYDFFIFTHRGFLTVVSYFIGLHVFIFMMNNVINVSGIVQHNVNQKIRNYGFVFLTGLFAVYLAMYLIVGLEFGYLRANYQLQQSYIIVILSSVYLYAMFSRITLKPGVVNKLSFNFLVGQFVGGRNYEGEEVDYANKQFKLFVPKSNRFVGSQFPVVVRVIHNVEIQGDDSWVLVEFEKDIHVANCDKINAVMRVKNTDSELYMDKVEVMVLLIIDYKTFEVRSSHHSSDFYYIGKVYSRPVSGL